MSSEAMQFMMYVVTLLVGICVGHWVVPSPKSGSPRSSRSGRKIVRRRPSSSKPLPAPGANMRSAKEAHAEGDPRWRP